jgi:hypothetical protein
MLSRRKLPLSRLNVLFAHPLLTALRRGFAALRSASEPVPWEDELETVLMFSLTGLAFSLYLAAQIPMTGDEWVGILTMLS